MGSTAHPALRPANETASLHATIILTFCSPQAGQALPQKVLLSIAASVHGRESMHHQLLLCCCMKQAMRPGVYHHEQCWRGSGNKLRLHTSLTQATGWQCRSCSSAAACTHVSTLRPDLHAASLGAQVAALDPAPRHASNLADLQQHQNSRWRCHQR